VETKRRKIMAMFVIALAFFIAAPLLAVIADYLLVRYFLVEKE